LAEALTMRMGWSEPPPSLSTAVWWVDESREHWHEGEKLILAFHISRRRSLDTLTGVWVPRSCCNGTSSSSTDLRSSWVKLTEWKLLLLPTKRPLGV
jgi:hypothetical protein